jgi:hypothetical protein
MNIESIESFFEPYIRVFGQQWNGHLDYANKMFAEVFACPVDGMIGVAFYAVDRQEFPNQMQIVDDTFEKLKEQFPQAYWSELTTRPFIDLIHSPDVIIVIKPYSPECWTEEQGIADANDTVGWHFSDTMPEEWKQRFDASAKQNFCNRKKII